ncbi:MAG: AAA family ATPase [Flavobacteriales bacterium]|nr:AAA family ATPase [Flavobacteriales bacterium]
MLKKIELENYRCFNYHSIEFKDTTIIVGKNNAGKSTIIEALRLVSIVVNRSLNFKNAPIWLEDYPPAIKGVTPSLSGLDFSTKNVFHKYQNGPAKITATFSNKSKIEINLGENEDGIEIFAVLFDRKGNNTKSKTEVKVAEIPEINILPQISALAKEETVLKYDTVRANVTTQLSSMHFRNQIKNYSNYFEEFKNLSEKTWPGLGIMPLEGRSLLPGGQLTLIVRDNDFAAEIGWMGHGLQMWLQTMWFLAKSSNDSTVILDEPDVYMHADLQRKLIRFLKKHFKQVLLATHSIEIISEVESENILIIDKSRTKSNYASSVPAVQSLINGIGSMQNIGLARLWSARKLLLVEGKDVDILKRIQETIYMGNCEPFDLIPRSSLGGWSGWQNVKGADLVLKNGLKQNVNVFCILDSDYHDDIEKEARINEAKKIGVNLHIWKKKEIENYLLSAHAIARILVNKNRTNNQVSVKIISEKLDEITEEMKTDFTDKISDEIQAKNRKLQPSTVNKQAREKVDEMWGQKLDVLSGKEILSRFNNWSMKHFKVSITTNTLASELSIDEIPNEMYNIIESIEKNIPIY